MGDGAERLCGGRPVPYFKLSKQGLTEGAVEGNSLMVSRLLDEYDKREIGKCCVSLQIARPPNRPVVAERMAGCG